jgi:hypothetical protein
MNIDPLVCVVTCCCRRSADEMIARLLRAQQPPMLPRFSQRNPARICQLGLASEASNVQEFDRALLRVKLRRIASSPRHSAVEPDSPEKIKGEHDELCEAPGLPSASVIHFVAGPRLWQTVAPQGGGGGGAAFSVLVAASRQAGQCVEFISECDVPLVVTDNGNLAWDIDEHLADAAQVFWPLRQRNTADNF